MASKSKKRRRVFRASCILAALIIAGSSFAWFTSKDEVTNRLSASGDYGVRIVESFAPPANWLPGQEVNKDVYAVNTGDVEAFVEETVSGTLTITREKAYTGTNNKPDADSIELSAAERYAIEAGSYLAYKPENSNLKPGTKVVAMTPDFEKENGYTASKATDFKPDAEGLYVFRRVINYPNEDQMETFEYDAYYYVPGVEITETEDVQVVGTVADGENEGKYKWTKHLTDDGDLTTNDTVVWTATATAPTEAGYTFTAVTKTATEVSDNGGKFYKVSNLQVTPDSIIDVAGDGVHTDGNLSAATAGFYKDVPETFDPTALRYEDEVTEGNAQHPKRLVVTYKLGSRDDLEDLADKYDDALVAYYDALAQYEAAVRDLNKTENPKGTNVLLTEATNEMQEKLDALRAAENAKKAAEDLVAEKLKAKNEAQAALEAAQGKQADAQQAYDDAVAAYNAAEIADAGADAAKTAAFQALGSEGDAWSIGNCTVDTHGTTETDDDEITADNNSAWAKYNKAKAAVQTHKANYPTAEDAFEAAFDAYVNDDTKPVANRMVGGTGSTKVDLDTVTYNQLDAMQLELNEGSNEYKYWKLVVAEKRAKEAKDRAQEAYDAAVEAQAQTAKDLAAATKAKQDAHDVLDAANGAVGGAGSGATATANAANQAYQDALSALGTEGDTYSDSNIEELHENTEDPTEVTGTVDNNTAWAKYNKALSELQAAKAAYDEALAKANADTTDLENAKRTFENAAQTLADAERAYEEAAAENDGEINIYVNLSDNVITEQTDPASGDKWQLLPTSLVDTDGDNKADTARFYYTSILGGGETSTKLIDSVTLDSGVTQDMFKYLDFDLNVDLKSAQIAIDSDGETILTTAADTILDAAEADLANPKDVDTAITWSTALPATPTSYSGKVVTKNSGATATYGETESDVTITRLATPVTIDGTTYYYKTDDTHFGTGLTANKEFIEVVETEVGSGVYTAVENGSAYKLTKNATAN